ncbi:MAG TPA: hypothetical protein VNJ08_07135 [Bacteriovoracaceae bacterium]|nr:hypothetical protein [Bacteriovoracaceae bacterium]
MNRLLKIALFLCLMTTLTSHAQVSRNFNKGSHELGLGNLGILYSNVGGFAVSANVRYQYYVLNRLSVGGFGFYNSIDEGEWMGLGPSASYILFTMRNWFGRLDQQITAAKFNGFEERMATLYGTSTLSVSYMPLDSNFFVGLGYAHSYALNKGEIIEPNGVQVLMGWFWR